MNILEHKNRVVIVGARISGLAVAYWLNAKGYDVTVLEKDSNPAKKSGISDQMTAVI